MVEVQLVEIHKIMEGGSSRPLLITAKTPSGELKKYVVKLFKKKYIDQNFSTAKEIFICELAKYFNLNVPTYAVINFDHRLLKDFYDDDYIKQLCNNYKFCSEFREPFILYNSNLTKPFNDHYDLANIFAFDNVIINIDRGGHRNKPNLLVNDNEVLLIDHETVNRQQKVDIL